MYRDIGFVDGFLEDKDRFCFIDCLSIDLERAIVLVGTADPLP